MLVRRFFPAASRCGLTLILCGWLIAAALGAETAPQYGRDVRPILSKQCFTCHGPDPEARQSGLRLDQAEAAYEDLGGYVAIKPGEPGRSEMFIRISSTDDDVRMPPSDTHPPLSAAQIDTIRRWILAGGAYERHWSFVAPQKSPVPAVQDAEWCRGEIDRFVLQSIEQHGLQASPSANREQIVRRLYLDLTGVTPTPEEVDRFVSDDDPKAYRRLVDRLLASPDYAERFARPWLDLARYSDTNGYEKDRPRTIWPFRDWVIQAIAADMPFDQFSIEQLAGDMLPGATAEQQIATGFHRNTMINEEGGIDPNEYRFHAMVDRVATTGTVWMGLTTGCAQCHTHKYDPITHTDYYGLFALLNNADEPDVVVPDDAVEAKRKEIEMMIRSEEDRLIDAYLPAVRNASSETADENPIHGAFEQWLKLQIENSRVWKSLRPDSMTSTMPKLTVLDDNSILASGDVSKREVYQLNFRLDGSAIPSTALKLEVLPHDSLPAGGPGVAFYEGRRGDFFLSELSVRMDGKPVALQDASHSYGNISVGSGKADAANVLDGDGSSGWSTSGQEGEANRLVVNFTEPIQAAGTLQVELLFERHFAAALGRFRLSLTDGKNPAIAMSLPQELDETFNRDAAQTGTFDDATYRQLQRHFVRDSIELKEQRKEIDRLVKSLPERVRTLGLRQRLPEDHRVTHRHRRGEYLQPEEVVAPAVPALFDPLDEALPADRLTFAKWLVSEQNPLVGRVTVNRAWREFFGTGIVDTAGDFGTQSEPPSHPELLDYLAVEVRDGGWSMKRLHRQIVLSSTYRQAVGRAPEKDPTNRLLSRFPHRRFDAERIRDAMLSAAGLLSRRVGGESVYPPQPASVSEMAYGNPKWETSTGGDRYRRSLYTFGKRTAPFAAYTTFDGPTGELCIARRDRSTTPLQALTLMNDAMYIEIARGLAETTVRELGEQATPQEIAARLFRRLLVRTAEPDELAEIVKFYQQQSKHKEPWMLVARALMNTDEAITTP